MARSTARRRALNTLYEADEKGQDILSLLDERIKHPGAQTPLPDYAIEIVRGVAAERTAIDRVLDRYSQGWHVGRMAVVDRNILRIATWEIVFNNEIPDKVAIDEALHLAKMLCDDESPAFIHGLLSAVSAAAHNGDIAIASDPAGEPWADGGGHGDSDDAPIKGGIQPDGSGTATAEMGRAASSPAQGERNVADITIPMDAQPQGQRGLDDAGRRETPERTPKNQLIADIDSRSSES